jgi:uncharacterized membrane protein
MTHQAIDDQRIEIIIGNLLRAGVLLAGAVVVLGAIVYLKHHGHELPNYNGFHGEPKELRTLSGIFSGALHGSGRALVQLGLVLLIATPVARVLFSVFAFAAERDWMYVVITLMVLAILLYSLFGY